MSVKIILASTNTHKVAELQEMLAAAKVGASVHPMQAFGTPPVIEEHAPDFVGNARLKSEGIARWLREGGRASAQDWVLADDSGLCVEALGGAPGVHSARYAGAGASDAQNNAKLVQELQRLGLDRSVARFCCALVLSSVHGGQSHVFEGQAVGTARVEPQGEGGFGYDPHVWLDGQAQSFAQMSRATKAAHSHRAHALKKLLVALPRLLSS